MKNIFKGKVLLFTVLAFLCVIGITRSASAAAPQATNLSAAESYTEDTALNLADIVVTDADSTELTVTLTLSNPAAGSLNTSSSGEVVSTYNAGTGVWSVFGAISDINTILAGLTFTPATNFNSSFTIATNVSDGGASVSGSKVLTGIAVNDAPSANNLSAAETYTQDVALNLVDIVVTDADSANVTATLTLSTTAAGSFSTATSGAVTSTYISGTGVWTASGAIANVNTLLAALIFTPTGGFSSNFTIATSVSDGIAAALTGTKVMTGIPATNHAPVLDASKSPTFSAVTEDAGAPSGAVGTLVSSLVDFTPPTGGLDNVTDSDGSPVTGIAITALNSANQTCYYSIDNGSTWNAIGAVSGSSARLLAASSSTRIYCQPNPGFSGTISNAITFRAWDQTSGSNGTTADTTSNGGASAFSTATDTASITVNEVILDTTAPTVESVSPADGTIGTAVDVPIVITFSEPMNPDSFSASISPCGLGSGSDECATLDPVWSDDDTMVTLEIANGPLHAATEYTVTIDAVTDVAGNDLGDYSSSFTTYIPLVLTEIRPIPSRVKARDAVYYFSGNEDAAETGERDYFSDTCGHDDSVNVVVDPVAHTYTLQNGVVGQTYECNFNLESTLRGTSNMLHVGPFTIISNSSGGGGGGRVAPSTATTAPLSYAPAPTITKTTLGEPGICPAAQIITQNLHTPSRNGRYNSYTHAIVKEATVLQAHLNRLGFNSGPVDGILGPLSDGAIKRMQTFLGTIPDGYVGPITRGLINNSCGAKS